MDAYIGKTLDGRYEMMEVIGTGGMAVVYKAMDHRLNRQVAVKVLKSDLAQNADFRRRFHDEAQAVAMLSHPNIVSVYDVSRDGDAEYIVMELIDGITLKQYMERRGQLNWREALHFITQIMKGLGHAHGRGIIHRDIKPHNIMVLRDGSVKVADFGIACLVASSENTLTQEALGSVHYISPEQAKGGHTDARTDIYSAGVVLYEMLTNRLPFEGESAVSIALQHISSVPLSPREINPEIPEPLELITMKAMASEPEKRYISAEAMLRDLEAFRKDPNINFDYVLSDFAVEENNEPTQHISAAELTEARQQRQQRHYDERREAPGRYQDDYDDDDEDWDDIPNRRRRKPKKIKGTMIAAIVAAVAVIVVLFAFIFEGFGKGGTEEYTVPDLRGQIYEDVINDAEYTDHFSIELASYESSEEYEKGLIISQTPEGDRTKKGPRDEKHVISVVVSIGAETKNMPRLLKADRDSAELMLKSLQLDLKIQFNEEFNDEVEANHVISTIPEENTELKKGDTVIITLSKGAEIRKIKVPSYQGKMIDEVRNNLDGLVLVDVKEEESDLPKGQILSQTLKENQEVEEGTEIGFTVSTGPIEPEPPKTVSITKSYALPEGTGSIHVLVKVGNEAQFDSQVDLALGEVTCTLTGSGAQQVSVYFDGVLTDQKEVVFS